MAKKSQRPAPTPSKIVNKKGLSFKTLFLALPVAIPVALWSSRVQQLLPARLYSYLRSSPLSTPHNPSVYDSTNGVIESCGTHKYTTEIVSLDPLVIYINNFTTKQEAEGLIKSGESDFQESFISRTRGDTYKAPGRTSSSAPLDTSLPLVSCLIARSRTFMGSMLLPSDDFSIPQLVRYFPSQKYNLHTDYWATHQVDEEGRRFNRVASFFVFLRDNCTEGETYFPLVDVLDRDAANNDGALGKAWSQEGRITRGDMDDEKQGVKFRPITGNAIFWVNLDKKGRGDSRMVHAGLPVGEGEKIGLNIWPRKYYGWVDGARGKVKRGEGKGVEGKDWGFV